MKTIPLTQGKVTLVDDDVYKWASKFKWYAGKSSSGKTFYAYRNSLTVLGKRHTVKLHREIMQPLPGMEVDHINRDGLNNCGSNLRCITHSQNQLNKSLQPNNSSGFRGTSWIQRDQKWRASIHVSGKNFHLGDFNSKENAARAYDAAAINFHGEFAQLNFPLIKTP